MTRSDYELIARVLNDPSLHLPESKRRAIVHRFVDELSARPAFDRPRFLALFGMEDDES